jgi:hypothetical protein
MVILPSHSLSSGVLLILKNILLHGRKKRLLFNFYGIEK